MEVLREASKEQLINACLEAHAMAQVAKDLIKAKCKQAEILFENYYTIVLKSGYKIYSISAVYMGGFARLSATSITFCWGIAQSDTTSDLSKKTIASVINTILE